MHKSQEPSQPDRSPAKKFSLVVVDDVIDIGMMQHHVMVHGTGHESNMCIRIPLAEPTQKRDHTQHVSKLVMLTNDEDALEVLDGKV
jgi:hypothetical protein